MLLFCSVVFVLGGTQYSFYIRFTFVLQLRSCQGRAPHAKTQSIAFIPMKAFVGLLPITMSPTWPYAFSASVWRWTQGQRLTVATS